MHRLALSLLAFTLVAPTAGHSRLLAAQPGVIEIDGARNPELLPEWLVWESIFGTLNLLGEGARQGYLPRYSFTTADQTALIREGARQRERERRALGRVELQSQAYASGMAPDALRALVREHLLAYRWEILDAYTRVRDDMSPEGLAGLEQLAIGTKAGLHSFVRRDELEFYRQPR